MKLTEAYIAAMLHDLKKVLLCSRRDDPGHYGQWRPDHFRLDDLSTQTTDPELQGALPVHQDLKAAERIYDLVRQHHGLRAQDCKRFDELDPVAVLAIRAADRMHKSLYYPALRGEPQAGMAFPFYYPFYGRPHLWLPQGKGEAKQFGNVATQFDLEVLPWANATEWFREIFQEAQNRLLTAGPQTPQVLVELSERYLADFAESTYLPVISLHFHQQLATALFLMLYRRLAPLPAHGQKVDFELCLNTIICPPEKLQLRLRDISAVRKISHRLQERLHAYLRQTYLAAMEPEFDFSHPDWNLFLFYSKDAFVLLNTADDQGEIENIARQVAGETKAVLTMETVRVRYDLTVELKGNGSGKTLADLSPREVEGVRGAEKPVDLFPVQWQTFAPPVVIPEKTLQACQVCGRPTNESELQEDQDTGDWACDVCRQLREEGYCLACRTFTHDAQCPYCEQEAGPRPSPRLLNADREDGAAQRVAYVMIRTNVALNDIRWEAEVLMARFREERKRLYKGGMAKQLAKTRTTDYGIYEYLQAALDLKRFQACLENLLKEHLPVRERQDRKALESYFLYRSPTLTVVLVDEEQLSGFWKKLQEELENLQVSYLVQAVACSAHFPVWAVLRPFLEERPFLRTTAAKARQVRELARARAENSQSTVPVNDVFNASKALRSLATQDRQKDQVDSKVIILRGGVERRFPMNVANDLFDQNAPWRRGKPPLSQLNAVADVAAELVAQPEDVLQREEVKASIRASLALELDARTHAGARKEKIDGRLTGNLWKQMQQLAVEEIPGLIRELAARYRMEDRARKGGKSHDVHPRGGPAHTEGRRPAARERANRAQPQSDRKPGR